MLCNDSLKCGLWLVARQEVIDIDAIHVVILSVVIVHSQSATRAQFKVQASCVSFAFLAFFSGLHLTVFVHFQVRAAHFDLAFLANAFQLLDGVGELESRIESMGPVLVLGDHNVQVAELGDEFLSNTVFEIGNEIEAV